MRGDQEPAGFDTFWNVWRPHRRKSDARDKACDAFRKAILRGANPDELAIAARWHIDHLSERDKPYIQLAASYLNGGGWKDDLDDRADYEARIEKARQQAPQGNVTPIRAALPANHFSRRYASGEFQS